MVGDKSTEPRIIEVAHGLNNRNTFICLDDLEEWRKKQIDDLELYSSYFRYYTDDPNVGGILGGFGMDFDDEQNPERARKEAIIVIKDLMNRFDIDENSISICFSGNKGFHVFINRRVFGVEPEYFMPKIYKSMVQELVEKHGLKTLDLKIYDRRRLIRLPGSRHGKSGLYKIPITMEELERFNIDKIRALAIKPRPLILKNEHKLSERAHKWYLQHKERVSSALHEKKIEFTEQDFRGEFPPCIKKRLEMGAKEGERNRCTWQLASYLLKRGMNKVKVIEILEKWRQRCDRGLHEFTYDELEQTVEKVFEVGGYGVGCSSEALEPFCVGKESCTLFGRREKIGEEEEIPADTFREAERILVEEDPLEYIRSCVNQIHAGDENLIKMAYLSSLSVRLASLSLHLWPIGSSQKGKSHLLYSTLEVLPKDHYEVLTSASPLSLFYYVKEHGENSLNGRLLFIDEIESSKLALPMLRSLTGQTEITPRHLSVYEGDVIDLKIVGRRVIWLTSTKTIDDDQIRNRFIFCNPDESREQDEAVYKLQILRIQKKVEEDRFVTAKAMTKIILNEAGSLEVDIPYLKAIKWPYKDRRWLFPLFIATIETVTKINYRKRKTIDRKVISTREDFEIAKKLWESCIEHIIMRVSKTATRILRVLGGSSDEGKTRVELSEKLGLSTRQVIRLLNELEEAGAVNSRIRPGTRSLEYWRAPLQALGEIQLDESKLNMTDKYDNHDIGHSISSPNPQTDPDSQARDRMSYVIDVMLDDSENSSNHEFSPIKFSDDLEAAVYSLLIEHEGQLGVLLFEKLLRRRLSCEIDIQSLMRRLSEEGKIWLSRTGETVCLGARWRQMGEAGSEVET